MADSPMTREEILGMKYKELRECCKTSNIKASGKKVDLQKELCHVHGVPWMEDKPEEGGEEEEEDKDEDENEEDDEDENEEDDEEDDKKEGNKEEDEEEDEGSVQGGGADRAFTPPPPGDPRMMQQKGEDAGQYNGCEIQHLPFLCR